MPEHAELGVREKWRAPRPGAPPTHELISRPTIHNTLGLVAFVSVDGNVLSAYMVRDVIFFSFIGKCVSAVVPCSS